MHQGVMVGRGGWIRVALPREHGQPWVAIRFEQRKTDTGDRLEPAAMYTEHVGDLERFPVAKWTGALNGPGARELILADIDEKTTLEEELDRWKRTARTTDKPQSRQARRILDAMVGRDPDLIVRGIRDDNVRQPDDFYEEVASVYAAALAAGRHNPAAEIAEKNDVGVDRVRGWIRESRNRGLLPPAGKAGRAG